jgi:hypothetical protein
MWYFLRANYHKTYGHVRCVRSGQPYTRAYRKQVVLLVDLSEGTNRFYIIVLEQDLWNKRPHGLGWEWGLLIPMYKFALSLW